MDTSDRPSIARLRLLKSARRAGLIKAWQLSGLAVTRYYRRLLQQHGKSSQALAERADDKDREFYGHLFRGAALPQRLSVLDIGCGMGDLVDYLQSFPVAIDSYLGIDLVDTFVDICRSEYLEPCRFQRANFISPSFAPREKFNLVVNMGVMVSRVLRYEEYVEYSIEKMLSLATGHILFNVITEVDGSLGNYGHADRVGNVTCLPRPRLEAILARTTRRAHAEYHIHEVRIYPDAADAFVRITL
ncbi:MAG: class I SAM-dependent methyltransferase [Kouleothrix sp.]|nr:class I SAM-dependent methyltransferase [Kouleothrix sp.]